jgi:hypothetical protein
MQRNHSHTIRRIAALAPMLLAVSVLAACGSSSKGSTTAAAVKTTASGARTAGSRFTALRECLKKNGITLPQRVPGKPGQGRPPSGGAVPFGGGRTGGFAGGALPKGVTRAQFEAAMKKCGGGARGNFGPRSRIGSASFKKALTAFATCMRKGGIDVPTPNTSGKGPIFDTKGLDVNSAKFRAAQQKCASLLRIPAAPGAAGAPGGAGAPQAPGGEGAPNAAAPPAPAGQ